MRIPIIAGNWKMNKTVGEGMALAQTLHQKVKEFEAEIEIIIAPPYTSLNKIAETLKDSLIKVSAQDMFWEDAGAFTGQISAPMLKDIGVTHVIIGHSERRQFFYETNTTVNKKIKAALKHNLIPIFCIGETLAEREAEKVEEIITTQLASGLTDITQDAITKIVIAYEPVWAIGTGKTATSEQVEEAHIMIRKLLTKKFGESHIDMVRIIYGGSVKPNNAQELLSKPNIDGALVGGASLKAEDFINIIKSAILV
ncbi:MAG: triose-phosphate isomerase [Coxiellaceae bacterium]|jgi:triosephosphate isomerase|nr:triose-phosphate isomerase [Coxiellaceae bacterium]